MRFPRRVLAAVDFSDRSRVALQFAARLACQFKADLHVLDVVDPGLAAAARRKGVDIIRDAKDELRAVVASTWPATECGLHFDVVIGPAATAIVEIAQRESADVIVMAAHGMSDAHHEPIGSTTEAVLRRSTVSVLVVPDQWQPSAPAAMDLRGEGPVFVGLDARIPAIEAAANAAVLTRALATERILVHVVPSGNKRTPDTRNDIERIAACLTGGVPTRMLIECGPVAASLANAARQHPHAIVAVGRSVHPNGWAAAGHTAYRILNDTELPVLMHVAH